MSSSPLPAFTNAEERTPIQRNNPNLTPLRTPISNTFNGFNVVESDTPLRNIAFPPTPNSLPSPNVVQHISSIGSIPYPSGQVSKVSTPFQENVEPESANIMQTPEVDKSSCCAICLSPFVVSRDASDSNSELNKPSRERYITPCNHAFHKGCIQGCRANDHGACPLCRVPLPAGLTPEQVRVARQEQEAAQQAARLRELMIRRARHAREAVRRSHMQAMSAPNSETSADGAAATNSSQVPSTTGALSNFPPPFLSALQVAARQNTQSVQPAQPTGDQTMVDLDSCSHCQIAVQDIGECRQCSKSFCGLCSVVNYDEREERLFCLSCIFDGVQNSSSFSDSQSSPFQSSHYPSVNDFAFAAGD